MNIYSYQVNLSMRGRTDYRYGYVVAETESEAKGMLLDKYPEKRYSMQKSGTGIPTIIGDVSVALIDQGAKVAEEIGSDEYED